MSSRSWFPAHWTRRWRRWMIERLLIVRVGWWFRLWLCLFHETWQIWRDWTRCRWGLRILTRIVGVLCAVGTDMWHLDGLEMFCLVIIEERGDWNRATGITLVEWSNSVQPVIELYVPFAIQCIRGKCCRRSKLWLCVCVGSCLTAWEKKLLSTAG